MRVIYTPLSSLVPEGFDRLSSEQPCGRKTRQNPENAPERPSIRFAPQNPRGSKYDQSVIGTTITIKGEVSGGQDMLINGCFEGRLSLPGHTVTVGKEGRVKAEMLAKVIQIGGFVEGTLRGEKEIRLCETGRVRGSLLTAPEIVLAGAANTRAASTRAPAPRPPKHSWVHIRMPPLAVRLFASQILPGRMAPRPMSKPNLVMARRNRSPLIRQDRSLQFLQRFSHFA